jgi:hypothetical protein
MNLRSLLIFSSLIILTTAVSAQSKKDTLIQFSGVIRNLKYEPVPNVHVIDINRRTGTTSNNQGIFSFIVTPSDSILFRSVGYKNTLVLIPDTIETGHYPRDVYMLNDTIHLAEVKIFPWKTYEDFKVAFLNLELPDQDTKNAVRNIELIKAQLNMDFEPDADLSFRNAMNQQYEKMYYQGQYPTIPILNPFNWAKFFQALKNGDFKSKEKK